MNQATEAVGVLAAGRTTHPGQVGKRRLPSQQDSAPGRHIGGMERSRGHPCAELAVRKKAVGQLPGGHGALIQHIDLPVAPMAGQGAEQT